MTANVVPIHRPHSRSHASRYLSGRNPDSFAWRLARDPDLVSHVVFNDENRIVKASSKPGTLFLLGKSPRDIIGLRLDDLHSDVKQTWQLALAWCRGLERAIPITDSWEHAPTQRWMIRTSVFMPRQAQDGWVDVYTQHQGELP